MGTSGWEDAAARMAQQAIDEAYVNDVLYGTSRDGMPARQMAIVMPVPLEVLIDSGQATPEQVAEYQRLQAMRAALPKPSPWRRFRWWHISQRERIRSAIHRRLWGVDHCDEYDQ